MNRLFLLATSALVLAGCGPVITGENRDRAETSNAALDTIGQDAVEPALQSEWNFPVNENFLASLTVPDGMSATPLSQGSELALVSAAPDGPAVGVDFKLPSDLEAAVSGKSIVVTVEARSESGQVPFSIAYYTKEVGNSGPREFVASTETRTFGFNYDVPVMIDGNGEVIRILPSASQAGESLILLGIGVSIVPVTSEPDTMADDTGTAPN